MKRRLTIVIALLFGAWLASLTILLLFLADLAGVPALVGAIVVQIGVAAVSAGILIETNTRRAWPADPYAMSTADLLRPPLLRGDERRQTPGTIDNRTLTQRISDMVESDAALRPPGATPAWAIDISRTHDRAGDAFSDARGDES